MHAKQPVFFVFAPVTFPNLPLGRLAPSTFVLAPVILPYDPRGQVLLQPISCVSAPAIFP